METSTLSQAALTSAAACPSDTSEDSYNASDAHSRGYGSSISCAYAPGLRDTEQGANTQKYENHQIGNTSGQQTGPIADPRSSTTPTSLIASRDAQTTPAGANRAKTHHLLPRRWSMRPFLAGGSTGQSGPPCLGGSLGPSPTPQPRRPRKHPRPPRVHRLSGVARSGSRLTRMRTTRTAQLKTTGPTKTKSWKKMETRIRGQ